MKKSFNFNQFLINKGIKYNIFENNNFNFSINNLYIKNVIKKWNFEGKFPICLAIFSYNKKSIKKLAIALAGYYNITYGQILINNIDVAYNSVGFDRKMVYVNFNSYNWNKLLNIEKNLIRTGMKNKKYKKQILKINKKIKFDIENFKNTGLNLDSNDFKKKIIIMIKNFIYEMQNTFDFFIQEYQSQINSFHQNFAKEKFNFFGNERLLDILINKLNSEEKNIIANNKLLFLQALQDRISSLENLVGSCFCGCKPPKERKWEFQLKEINFIIKEINNYLDQEILITRNEIINNLKKCNNYNQIFNIKLNYFILYKQITLTRNQINQILDYWIDLAEIQRIKFNIKQEFLATQLLSDEMNLFLKNIKDEIKIYHDKILSSPQLQDKNKYCQKLQNLYSKLINIRYLVSENIDMIFKHLDLYYLLSLRFSQLTILEKTLIKIIEKLIIPTKILILDNPFAFLNICDKKKLSYLIKKIQEFLKIIVIFTTNNQVDINLLATNVTFIENQIIIQQENINDFINKPLTLNLLQEMNQKYINIAKGEWKKNHLYFYNINLGKFKIKMKYIIAFKSNIILFSIKKPLFIFFKKIIIINCFIQKIIKIDNKKSYLVLKTIKLEYFKVLIDNNNDFKLGNFGWIIIPKNSLFIFDFEKNKLIDTW